MRPVVLDLDQTLIRGEVADWELWLDAISEALGVRFTGEEDWSVHPVHTDHGIVESLSQEHRGRSFGEDERAVFEAKLFARHDAWLARDPGMYQAIPGAGALLSALEGRAGLATGNLHPVTRRKLRSAGLDHVHLPCQCSAPGLTREALVASALRRVGWAGGEATSFGDGVWDVRAARSLGIGFVGVAQSDGHEAKLRAAGARRVLRDFADLTRVLTWIEEAEVPAEESRAEAWQAPRG